MVTVKSVKVLNKYVMSTINVNNEFNTTTLHGRNGQCKTRQLRFAKYQKLGKFKTSSKWESPPPFIRIAYRIRAGAETLSQKEGGGGLQGSCPEGDFKQPLFCTEGPTFGQIVDTDYETYMIIYLTRGLDTFLTLEGRQQNITPDLETKFKNVAASVGITGEVVPVVLKETC
ncbi:hypothetical protein NXF25_017081 [Crotalus adamanteus]|uniref:Lipocalin/cytosolic fatty-acid binding domain-containing protein n=1 Tax=Crotalus adamanteus TaxID=8729 RepID=A0AAW1AR91_CROAD